MYAYMHVCVDVFYMLMYFLFFILGTIRYAFSIKTKRYKRRKEYAVLHYNDSCKIRESSQIIKYIP